MTCLLGNRSNHRPHHRRGVTLVELLIVIGITSLIAAVALPSVKTLLKDRKTNQAAIQVRGFIESAKAMAIAKGREVAVVLDRMSDSGDYNPAANNWFSTEARDLHRNTVLRLSLAEVLPPYTGDLDNSTCMLAPSTVQGPSLGSGNNRAIINIAANPSLVALLRSGLVDKIAIGDRSDLFDILVPISQFNENDSMPPATKPPLGFAWIEFENERTANQYSINHSVVPLTSGPHTFRIYCKPRRLYSKPMQRPKGTCIDLGLSGMGVVGTNTFNFSAQWMEAFEPNNTLGVNTVRPVYLVFDSRGSLSSLYGNFSGMPSMSRQLPNSDIYLLVGKTDKVLFPGAAISDPAIYGGSNLADSTSYWLKISSSGGQVAMAPVLPPSLTPDATGVVSLATALAESRGAAQASVDLSAR
jgi:prepilin-type N-terminal cleavage/methylation domain-containing protein